ncbi:Predicted oxidoreductase [Halopelagius inordinatus]|uniref:Predicted oxidoreductase n=1 Tax=Halopelagius inordinatus TaxID=553467 RepID=A0A1I2SW36_9EURY|nr:aldo/keto reductase [Halopelagius inordinatus]SFG55127.1 Predicted oxidoreductase [Halopelagius inordinatus]
MEYTTFGQTGTTVSEICLGGMSFGTGWDEWTLDRAESRELIERAIELGINFFDTANVYSYGESEEILGEVLSEYDRDEFVVATKVYGQMDENDPNSGGLSRKTIEQELDASLDRLGMETVDLYQIHRWDYDTPIETTLRALDDAVRRGKVRHLGASSMWAHQFADALHTADSLGLERFASMQNLYNLAYREEEREMLPLCEKEGVAVMPWSPLAAGFLTRPHEEFDATTRGEHEASLERGYTRGGGPEINERVQELAAEKGVKMAQIALAWQFHKEHVTTPIVGTSSVEHLEDAVEALDIDLSESDIEYLEDPYEPVPVAGHD